MKPPQLPCRVAYLLMSSAVALVAVGATHATAEDWGVYSLTPASGQTLVLEAVDAGRAEGTAISINNPTTGSGRLFR